VGKKRVAVEMNVHTENRAAGRRRHKRNDGSTQTEAKGGTHLNVNAWAEKSSGDEKKDGSHNNLSAFERKLVRSSILVATGLMLFWTLEERGKKGGSTRGHAEAWGEAKPSRMKKRYVSRGVGHSG